MALFKVWLNIIETLKCTCIWQTLGHDRWHETVCSSRFWHVSEGNGCLNKGGTRFCPSGINWMVVICYWCNLIFAPLSRQYRKPQSHMARMEINNSPYQQVLVYIHHLTKKTVRARIVGKLLLSTHTNFQIWWKSSQIRWCKIRRAFLFVPSWPHCLTLNSWCYPPTTTTVNNSLRLIKGDYNFFYFWVSKNFQYRKSPC